MSTPAYAGVGLAPAMSEIQRQLSEWPAGGAMALILIFRHFCDEYPDSVLYELAKYFPFDSRMVWDIVFRYFRQHRWNKAGNLHSV
jgi:hypothetical protein